VVWPELENSCAGDTAIDLLHVVSQVGHPMNYLVHGMTYITFDPLKHECIAAAMLTLLLLLLLLGTQQQQVAVPAALWHTQCHLNVQGGTSHLVLLSMCQPGSSYAAAWPCVVAQ
jgi:hypothetical protein